MLQIARNVVVFAAAVGAEQRGQASFIEGELQDREALNGRIGPKF